MGRAPLTRADINETLRLAGLSPRHRWGQNFLLDSVQLEKIVDLAEIVPGEVVLEVGPGFVVITDRVGKQTEDAVDVDSSPARQHSAGTRLQYTVLHAGGYRIISQNRQNT